MTMASTIGWTSMFDIEFALVAALTATFVALCAIGLGIAARRQLARSRAEADGLRGELDLIRQSISGLTAGTVGMDRRIRDLEQREKALAERQESYEIQHADEQPYGHAIRLVQQGASSRRLINELDLSENEADLIVRLHGHRESA